MGKFDNYLYYKGEKKNPFNPHREWGKNVWWIIESYAVERGDNKEKGKLSKTMLSYIKERVWQSDSQWNTSLEIAIKRAHELYIKGLWDASYISYTDRTIEEAERMNYEI